MINPKPARVREMTLNIQYGNGVSIVVSGFIIRLRRGIMTLTWRRETVIASKIKSLDREENLNATNNSDFR